MKNTITLLLVSIFIFATAGASADYENKQGEKRGIERNQELTGVDAETQAAIQELHEAVKAEMDGIKEAYGEDVSEEDKEEIKAKIEEIRAEHNANVIELLGDNTEAIAQLEARSEKMGEGREKGDYKRGEAKDELLAELDDDTRAELEALYEDHKAAIDELKDASSEDMSDEEKAEKKEAFEALNTAHQEKVAVLLADYPEILEVMQEKQDSEKSRNTSKGKGDEERSENTTTGFKKEKNKPELPVVNRNAKKSQENGIERAEKVEKWNNEKKSSSSVNAEKKGQYKQQFVTQYQSRLENISDENLEKVLEKIVSFTVKTEANNGLTDEKKENTLAQLEALSEIIQDILENDDSTDDIIDQLLN